MGDALYLGAGPRPGEWVWAKSQTAVLVLGPPRSGKTTGIVVPNVLSAPGPVVSTSTKPDVLEATLGHRSQRGRCWLYDPTGTVPTPAGASQLRWSPIPAAREWDRARATARQMVGAGRAAEGLGDARFWAGRAATLLGPLLHAAALEEAPIDLLLRWVDRRELAPASVALEGAGATLAADALAGVAESDRRELSAAFSTAEEALGAYRSEAALTTARSANFEPVDFIDSADTVYVCATSEDQELCAPLVVGLISEIRAAAYARAAGRPRGAGGPSSPEGLSRRPAATVVLALDEAANIAPLPDLPAMVSQGGGQGVLTLACLQDLSQARARWGPAGDGFLSLFGTKLVLPGIGEPRTLEAISSLCGDIEVPVRSATRTGPWWRRPGSSTSVTWSTRRQRRLPVAAVSEGSPGQALCLEGGEPPARVGLTPWFAVSPWRDLGPVPERRPGRAPLTLEKGGTGLQR